MFTSSPSALPRGDLSDRELDAMPNERRQLRELERRENLLCEQPREHSTFLRVEALAAQRSCCANTAPQDLRAGARFPRRLAHQAFRF